MMGICSPQIRYSSVHTILVCYSVGCNAVLLYMQLGFSIHVKLRYVRTSELKNECYSNEKLENVEIAQHNAIG